LAHLIDWDAPVPAYGGGDRMRLLWFFRRLDGFFRGLSPEAPMAWRADMERDYRAALVAVANRAVLRDTLRRKALTPDG
jgi:hypothetical protein